MCVCVCVIERDKHTRPKAITLREHYNLINNFKNSIQYWDPRIAEIAQYFANTCPGPNEEDEKRGVPGLFIYALLKIFKLTENICSTFKDKLNKLQPKWTLTKINKVGTVFGFK